MVIIGKPNRQIDDVIFTYEVSTTNTYLMNMDGSLITCRNNRELLHILEKLPPQHKQSDFPVSENAYFIVRVDGISVVHKIVAAAPLKVCKELVEVFN